jgi:acyl carrier protein
MIQEKVRTFVTSNFYVGSQGIGDDESLVDSGLVDSTGVLELIVFLEEEFGIEIGDEEVVSENLGSIARAAAFVERKLDASPYHQAAG